MTQPPKPPREFWIDEELIGLQEHQSEVFMQRMAKVGNFKLTHVIEYCDYELIKAKLDIAWAALENCEKVIVEILAKIKE